MSAGTPLTDVPQVAAAQQALARLADIPVRGHPAIFDDVQRLLADALESPTAPPVASAEPGTGQRPVEPAGAEPAGAEPATISQPAESYGGQ